MVSLLRRGLRCSLCPFPQVPLLLPCCAPLRSQGLRARASPLGSAGVRTGEETPPSSSSSRSTPVSGLPRGLVAVGWPLASLSLDTLAELAWQATRMGGDLS